MRQKFLQLVLVGLLVIEAVFAPNAAVSGPDRASDGKDGGAVEDQELVRQADLLEMPVEELRGLQGACREAGFTSEEFSRWLTLATRAKLAGLPHSQLLSKLREGLAKRALPEQVLQALQDRARRLRAAKDVVDQLIVQGWLAPDYTLAVAMIADAMDAGASPAELIRVVRTGEATLAGVPDVRTAFRQPNGGQR